MRKRDLIKQLERYPDDIELNFYLLPDDKGIREETSEYDEALTFVGEIYTGGVEDGGALGPYLDIGLERKYPIIELNEEKEFDEEHHSSVYFGVDNNQ